MDTVAQRRASARASIRPRRSVGYELARMFFLGINMAAGWTVEEAMPADRKMVIMAAPHTTNWDLLRMLGVAFYYRVPVRWMGKKSLGEGPFGWVMRWWGLLPVDRSKPNSLVSQVADAFAAVDEMAVVIAPEGTRSDVREWKTGFYMIAVAARVPIALGFMDYHRKVGGVGGPFWPSGDYGRDLLVILEFYHDHVTRFEPPQIMSRNGD